MSGSVRRCAVWVALAVMPGLLALAPVGAGASPAAGDPPSGVPELSLPEVEAPLPEAPSAPDGTLSVPADPAKASRRAAEDVPEPDHELVDRRDAVTKVFENTDGTQTVTIYGEPVHYRPARSSAWKEIDNTLVADATRPGWVRNKANDWTARFGPIEPGGLGGVEVVTDAGPVRFAPELPAGHAPVSPVVGRGDDADTVTYPDVWPGVDVRYVVSGGRVKEDVVVRAAGQAAFPFVTEGLGLKESTTAEETSSVDVTSAQGDEVALLAPEVLDADGRLADDEAAPAMEVAVPAPADRVVDTAVAGAPQRLTVSVDDAWLDAELASGDAVVVDPTLVVLDGFWHTAYKSDGYNCTGCGVKVGNSQGGAGGAPTYWHTNGGFSYWSSITGKQVLYAGLKLTKDANTQSSSAQPVTAYWATGDGYGHAVANGDPTRVIGTQTIGDVGEFDVTSTVNTWYYFGLQGEGFGFSGAETTCTQSTPACYTYRSFTAQLRLNVNSAPTVPSLVAPANESLAITSTTPTLKWGTVTDADGDPVTYTAKIATGLDGASGLVATGPAGSATTWQVPAGVLRDGVTYYWAVWAGDGVSWTKSAVRKLTVNSAGVAAPTDDFAGVSTNLVTGNASLTVPGMSLPTVGGGIGVNFSYDSQAPGGGLKGVYRVDQDQDNVIDTGSDPVVLSRDDAQVSFNWTGAAEGTADDAGSPSPGVPAERYSAVWTGSIAIPSGTWQLGARADDGVRIYVDGSGTPVVDDWVPGTMPAAPVYQTGTVSTGVHTIKIEYFQATGPAGVELWARNTAPDPDVETVVPAGWLSGEPRVLPAGWRLDATDGDAEYQRAEVTEGSVTLVRPDGSALAFPRTAFGMGFAPPKGVEDVVTVNVDGTVTVHADSGRTYLFGIDGALVSSTSAVDESSTSSAAAVMHYDSVGRLDKMTDPVSEQFVTLRYAPDAGCQHQPPILGGSEFSTPSGMLCRIDYWDSTRTDLYYKNGLLGYVRNPGDAYWGLSYHTSGKLAGYHDALAYDAALSGARSDWAQLLVELTYDASGRVATVTQQPPMQGDPRPARTYGYSPTVNANGELTGGTATATRAGVSGTYRSVAYDGRGRGTGDTDVAGLTTTSVWDATDQVIRTDEPGGLRSTTLYDQESQPTDSYGPAPAAQFNPNGTGQAGVPHEASAYDGGVDGLAVVWWPNVTYAGMPTVHQHDPGVLDSNWTTGSPAAGIPADNFAGRYTGEIVFPATGTYTLRLERDNKLNLFIDDSIRLYEWANTAAGTSGEVGIASGAAGESHRIRIDFGETTGSATLKLQWKTPGSSTWVTVPATALRTGFGLTTTDTGTDGTASTTQYADAVSNLGIVHGLPTASTTDPSGVALTTTTRYETAGYRRRLAEVMPSGAIRALAYYGDTETRDNPCTPASDPANQAGRQRYDTAPDPDGAGAATAIVKETVYDASGRLVATHVGPESWTCTTYDARGRVTRIVHPAFGGSPVRTVDYSYMVDPDGSGPRVTSPLVNTTTDAAGTITLEIDVTGQPVSQKDVLGNTTTFTYDQVGRQTASTGPAGTIEHTYDTADRLTAVRRGGQVLANGFTYDTAGKPTGVTYPSGAGNAGNGTTGTLAYDTLGRLASITWTGPGSTAVTSDVVTRDAAGRIVNQVVDGSDHHAGNDFAYDAAGRLVDAWVPGARYQYDYFQNGFCIAPDSFKNTNRTGMTVTPTGGSAVQTHYCYDHADRMTSATDAVVGTIAYDAHGNTTGIFGETRTYDSADRHLTTTKAGTTVTYVRDALDRIVERKVNGTTVASYGYSGSSDVASLSTDSSGTVLAIALPGGTTLNIPSGSASTWSHSNVHGDIVAVTSAAGAKVGTTAKYEPFGTQISGTTPDNFPGAMDFGWLGSAQRLLEHEASLQPVFEMGARQYSPLLGRFLEVDPVVGGSNNAYEYARGDSVNRTDIFGLWTCRHNIKTMSGGGYKFQVCVTATPAASLRAGKRRIGAYIKPKGTWERIQHAWGAVAICESSGCSHDQSISGVDHNAKTRRTIPLGRQFWVFAVAQSVSKTQAFLVGAKCTSRTCPG